nr:MAG TPA: hypothetical protein [Caudoviricetes sp.]DAU34335.1 MAG TPA: hypothetical protein [Caudoviricetes sp.]
MGKFCQCYFHILWVDYNKEKIYNNNERRMNTYE